MNESTNLSAVALVCTLKASPAESSSDVIARQLLDQFDGLGVSGSVVRVVDHNVAPGVLRDVGDPSDEWSQVLEKVLAADILVFATPTWLGHMSSVAQRVLERLDAEISETDDAGRPSTVGKVAVTAVVGNEDGAHKITADLMQALNDIGFTIPAQGGTYWNDEAMGSRDYKDLDSTPDAVAATNKTLVRNAHHLAALLKTAQYPAYE